MNNYRLSTNSSGIKVDRDKLLEDVNKLLEGSSNYEIVGDRKIIKYLDNYHMLSRKHVNYLKWRKVYQLIQENRHILFKDQERIFKLKQSMSKFH